MPKRPNQGREVLFRRQPPRPQNDRDILLKPGMMGRNLGHFEELRGNNRVSDGDHLLPLKAGDEPSVIGHPF